LRNGDWGAGIINEEAQRFRKRVRIRQHLKSGIGNGNLKFIFSRIFFLGVKGYNGITRPEQREIGEKRKAMIGIARG
jgi:hypothetical protein